MTGEKGSLVATVMANPTMDTIQPKPQMVPKTDCCKIYNSMSKTGYKRSDGSMTDDVKGKGYVHRHNKAVWGRDPKSLSISCGIEVGFFLGGGGGFQCDFCLSLYPMRKMYYFCK